MTQPSSGLSKVREADALRKVTERLRTQFPELPEARVDAIVQGRYEQFDGRPIRDFVPVLVERSARQELAGV
jgi:hypothetical protein